MDFCENPMLFIKKPVGKYEIVALNYKAGAERWLNETQQDYVLVPCGKCFYCQLQYQRQWLQRMYNEMKYHKTAYFITLTYAYAPRFIVRKDLTNFIKRLRKHYKVTGLKYFASQEYGSLNRRPHIHLIIFDLPMTDYDQDLQDSNEIHEIWGKGITQVCQAELGSFSYVAGYNAKKSESANRRYLELMKSFPRAIKPYCVMSKGIGKRFFMDNYKTIYKSDSVIISDHNKTYAMKPARYYDRLLEKVNPKLFKEIKDNRKLFTLDETLSKLKSTDLEIDRIYHYKAFTHDDKIKAKRYSI